MLYCGKCLIKIRGNKKCCPLCQGDLTGIPSSSVFPSLKRERISNLSLLKIFTFFMIALKIVFTSVWFLFDDDLDWVRFVMMSTFIVWMNVVLGVYFRDNMVKNITLQIYLIMIIGFILDWYTGLYGWSMKWIIPCCFLCLLFLTICIGKSFKVLLEDYILYLVVNMVLVMGQVLLLMFRINMFIWPAVISMASFGILGVAVLLFHFRELQSALVKLFHI
ncbi:MAG: hypothetical protein HUJ74_02695 [Lachnospiraceae bacterium]|nr:hypothetical protein [Lachnospiraceae bacterium]